MYAKCHALDSRCGYQPVKPCQTDEKRRYELFGIVGMVLDTVVDHRKSENHTGRTQNPSGDKYIEVSGGGSDVHSTSAIRRENTYGTMTASACHTPAAPADCNPLSVDAEFEL